MLEFLGPYQINGVCEVPGDKSISHRSIILAALTNDEVNIDNFLLAEDCLSSLNVMRKLGLGFELSNHHLKIKGCTINGFKEPDDILYVSNSGTTIRLFSGFLCACNFMSILSGDSSINNRPMDRIIKPLTIMGAKIFGRSENTKAPIVIFGIGPSLKGANFEINISSAQVKSCLSIAALFAKGPTEILQPLVSRDHTERMLEYFGAKIEYDGRRTKIWPSNLVGKDIYIPGDFSSAAYFIVAGLILNNSIVEIKNVGINPTRTYLLKILKKMGAKFEIKNKRVKNNEEIADIKVYSSNLKSINIESKHVPNIIDEIPILSVAAVFAEGTSIIKGASELRIKESDRLRAISNEFKKLGILIEELEDGLIIHGNKNYDLKSAKLESYNDHRIAMSLSILALKSQNKITIDNTDCIETSFPNFEEKLFSLLARDEKEY